MKRLRGSERPATTSWRKLGQGELQVSALGVLELSRSESKMTTASPRSERRLRLLVAISSYGEKNLHFLEKLIENYRKMAMAVDVVVVSNAPKDLGPDVNVVVG